MMSINVIDQYFDSLISVMACIEKNPSHKWFEGQFKIIS